MSRPRKTPRPAPPSGPDPGAGQPSEPVAPKPGTWPRATHALAERHEALWLRLSALHKDIVALGTKQPGAPTSEPVRIVAEGLLSDALPFTRQRKGFPVAATDLAGLAVQLGQALAALDRWESLNTTWDERYKCRVWRLDGEDLPVMRLNPPAAALKQDRADIDDLRHKLARRIDQRRQGDYERGFAAGRAARAGAPEPEPQPEPAPAPQIYPRLTPLG